MLQQQRKHRFEPREPARPQALQHVSETWTRFCIRKPLEQKRNLDAFDGVVLLREARKDFVRDVVHGQRFDDVIVRAVFEFL